MFYTYGETEINHLKRRDKKMAAAIERLGMLERPLSPDLFAALIRNIVDQQISVKAAQTVNTRLTLLLGSITPPPLPLPPPRRFNAVV